MQRIGLSRNSEKSRWVVRGYEILVIEIFVIDYEKEKTKVSGD